MKKLKLMGLFSAVIVFMLIFAVSSSAADNETYTYKNLTYIVLENDTIKTVSYDGSSKKYTVPSKIDGKAVTVIGAHTFSGCPELEALTIPGSVKELQEMAIAYCPKLTSLTIKAGSLKEIGSMDIYSCFKLKTISLPKNISSMSFFYDCDAVEKVTINSGSPYYKSYDGVVYTKDLKTLVYYPPGKKTVYFVVPDSVDTITRTAFNGAKNLEGVYIPKTVKEIGETAFGYTSVTIYYEGSKTPEDLEPAFYPWAVVHGAAALDEPGVVTASKTSNSISLKWNKVDGATGYRVYVYDSKTKAYKTVTTTTKNSYKISGLKPNTSYKYAVKAYVKTVSGNVWADESTKITVKTAPAAVDFNISSNDGKVTFKWDKVPGATGYVIYVSTSKNGTYKKLASTKKLTYTKNGYEEGETYYFKIRAYAKTDDGNAYGSYSEVKSIKIK